MELQDVIEAGYSVDDFLDKLVEVNENSKGILLDDFVLTMSENVNRQSTVKLKVPKNRKSKTKSPYTRCNYTIDWIDESSNESNHLTASSNDLTNVDK